MQTHEKHTILLGGVGGDSHSVGLTILRQSLHMNGYSVHSIGPQNCLEEFFRLAPIYNVVMISSLDGHARYYLRNFPELMKRYQAHNTLWYVGGNLHIGDGCGYERHFLEMGFNRAFTKFTDISTVLNILERDLEGVKAKAHSTALCEQVLRLSPYPSQTLADDRFATESFFRTRREVLEQWKTGYPAHDFNENAEFLARQPSFAQVQAQANAGQIPLLVHARTGTPLLEDQMKLFKALKSVGIPILSYQVDSLTRNGDFVGAEEALAESRRSDTATINGFPVINHGVSVLRQVITDIKMPLQTRHSARDPRLLAEISYAGGVTAFEGGCIGYNVPYYKDYLLDESIKTWQYIDRLTGLYYEHFGIVLDREFFGALTGTLVPPCLAIAANIIEAILAIRQGVKSISLGYAEQGNRLQDIAAMRMLKEMTADIIQNMGYKDIQINTVFHQYMAAFPEDPQRAEDLIYNSAITAALSNATRIIVKTPAEAYRIPRLIDHLLGVSLVMRGVAAGGHQQVDEVRVNEECDIIRREVQAILDSLLMCGHGSIAEGVVTGFRKGFIDIPFAPSIYNKGEVITARDVQGAVRFLSTGNLQFERELREFHRDKMAERRQAEGNLSEKQGYLLVEKDVLQITRGQYKCWPLGQ